MSEYKLQVEITGDTRLGKVSKHATHADAVAEHERLVELFPDYAVVSHIHSPAGHVSRLPRTDVETPCCLTYEWDYPIGDRREYFASEAMAEARVAELQECPDRELVYSSIDPISEAEEDDRPR